MIQLSMRIQESFGGLKRKKNVILKNFKNLHVI